MRAPEIHVELTPEGGRVYVNGILCRAAKAVVAHPGADVMILFDRDAVRVDRAGTVAAPEQDVGPAPARLALATDGEA